MAGVTVAIAVGVRLGVIVRVSVVVGLAGKVQDGRGVVEGVMFAASLASTTGEREGVLVRRISGVGEWLDKYRASEKKKIRIDKLNTPNMMGRAYRVGVVWSDIRVSENVRR